MYSGYGIVFDGTSSYNFGNCFARNVASFGADNSLLSRTENCKNSVKC